MKKLFFYMLILLLSVTAISCGKYDFWDTFATESSKMPASISIIDADPDEDFLSGDIKIGKAENEKNITEYRIYWGSSADVKSSSTPVASLKPTGSDLTLTLSHMHVPSGATHLIAVSAGSEGEMTKYKAVDFEDFVVRLEKDIYSGAGNSSPEWITEINGKLYFFSVDSGGDAFRSYDPSTGNLNAVSIPISPVIGDDSIRFAFKYNNYIYFKTRTGAGVGQFQLFRTDGINPPDDITSTINTSSDPSSLFILNDILYFFAYDGISIELYSFDLSSSVRTKLTNITGTPQTYISGKTRIISMNNILYFSAYHLDGKIRLYQTDGTPGNEVPINDFNSSNITDAPGQIIVYNNQLYFGADNNDGYGNELWISDGSSLNGVIDIITGNVSSSPYNFFIWNNYLYFIADSGTGRELHRTDGSSTQLIAEINSSGDAFDPPGTFGFPRLMYYNNKIYMMALDGGTHNELWVTDGVPVGDTHMVSDIFPGTGSNAYPLAVFNNKLFFSATESGGPRHLWMLDSSIPAEFNPSGNGNPRKIVLSVNSDPKWATVINNKMYFSAQDPLRGRELWVLFYK